MLFAKFDDEVVTLSHGPSLRSKNLPAQETPPKGGDSFIHSFIHLPNNTTEKKKYSNMYSRAEQQGKGTGSCPEITEQHKDYTTNEN